MHANFFFGKLNLEKTSRRLLFLKDTSYSKSSILLCRIGQLVGEFESMFLSDIESGKLPVSDLYCGLEGECILDVFLLGTSLSLNGFQQTTIMYIVYLFCRGAMDEFRWRYISNLHEHTATGFLFLKVIIIRRAKKRRLRTIVFENLSLLCSFCLVTFSTLMLMLNLYSFVCKT